MADSDVKDIVLDASITEQEIKDMFGGDEEIVEYAAKKALPVIQKIPVLKYGVSVLGVMKDWSLMKRKITQYEQKFILLNQQIEDLNQAGKLNFNFIKSEEFINNTLYLTEGIERSYDEEQIDNLRRAYINLLKDDNSSLNLKSKYMEIASKITPFHISILNEIVDVFNELYKKEDKIKLRNRGVTVTGASRKLLENIEMTDIDISYLIRDLEKYNLIITEGSDGSQYKGILKPEGLILKKEFEFTNTDIISELQLKGFLDDNFTVTEKLSNLLRDGEFNKFILNEKFNIIINDLYNILIEKNKNFEDLQDLKVDEFHDKTIISRPTGFGIKFLEVVINEPSE